MVHAGVGAATGAINAAITGGDAGFGALTGGVSGGISRAMGGILPNRFATQIGGRMLTGAVSGGFTAVIVGGDFKQGMFDGAWTAGFAYIFNETLEEFGNRMNYMFKRAGIGTDPGHLFSRTEVTSITPDLSPGQQKALFETGLVAALITGGIISSNLRYVVAGIPMLEMGLTKCFVEFIFNGDTSKLPSNWEVFGEVSKGSYKALRANKYRKARQ
ncbi:MAG: hypothetical protein AAGU11_08970 [Syntrophobacteraceae bacterium]